MAAKVAEGRGRAGLTFAPCGHHAATPLYMNRLYIALALALPFGVFAQTNSPQIALHTWATGLTRPVYVTNAGDDRLFLVQRQGVIKIITDSMQVAPTPFLNITSEVTSSGSVGDEQGLLSMVFDPEYVTNGFFYVYYINGSGSGTSRISRFHVSDDPNVADPGSEVILYTRVQPYSNHNGGCLQFGPDGYLYCGFGDGGSFNDPQGNGQNLSSALASMIRLDVSAHDATYAIPPTNPFVGAQDTLPEIWASGLRNPWRYSFDRLTGDLWIGDVGQGAWEELDFWPAGDNSGPNFGWRCREGLVATPGVSQTGCGAAADYVPPIAVFNHTNQNWCSIIGGYVYRGPSFPHLYGKYIFTDYCAGDFLSSTAGGQLDTLLMTTTAGYSAFGEDVNGELYVVDVSGGTVKKIVDACPMDDPQITFDGTTLSSTDATTWQWYLDGAIITGATAQNFAPQVNGSYTVNAGFGAPCNLFSDPLVVLVTGIHSSGGNAPAIFPQPALDRMHLRAGTVTTNASQIELFDAMGRLVRTYQWPAGALEVTIDVSGAAPGNYVVRGSNASGTWYQSVELGR